MVVNADHASRNWGLDVYMKAMALMKEIPGEETTGIFNRQEPMCRSMQLNYTPVTTFSQTDLVLDRIFLERNSRGSAMNNHKKLIDVTESLDLNCLSFTKEEVY